MQRFLSIIAVLAVLTSYALSAAPKNHPRDSTEVIAKISAISTAPYWRVFTVKRSAAHSEAAAQILVIVTNWPDRSQSDSDLLGRAVRISGRWETAKRPPAKEDVRTLYEYLTYVLYQQRELDFGDRPNAIRFFIAYSIDFDTR